MTQDSEQGASAGATGAAASPMAAAAGGVMTLGSVLTVAGILLLFVIFAIALVSLQYCFNAWDRGRELDDTPSGRRGQRRGGGGGGGVRRTRGVDPELLRSLPVTVYHRGAAPGSTKGEEEEEGAVECAVCLAGLEDGEEARFLPRCGHGFHAGCVDTWLASHTTCPLCRLTVAKPDALPAAPCSALLPPVPPEPATYGGNLPASVLLGLYDRGVVTVASDGGTSASAAGALVIEIPETAVPTAAPRDAAKSPGSARLRSSFRRLWSFGRQGPAGPSSSCACAGTSEGADVEQGIGVATDRPESNARFLTSLQ